MKRFLLLLFVLCVGSLQSPVHAQELARGPSLRSLNAKLDLILKRMDLIEHRLDEFERSHERSRFSLLRTRDKLPNMDSAKVAPLVFDFAIPLEHESDGDGERVFSGIHEGMRIDALQRRLRQSKMDMLPK